MATEWLSMLAIVNLFCSLDGNLTLIAHWAISCATQAGNARVAHYELNDLDPVKSTADSLAV